MVIENSKRLVQEHLVQPKAFFNNQCILTKFKINS